MFDKGRSKINLVLAEECITHAILTEDEFNTACVQAIDIAINDLNSSREASGINFAAIEWFVFVKFDLQIKLSAENGLVPATPITSRTSFNPQKLEWELLKR